MPLQSVKEFLLNEVLNNLLLYGYNGTRANSRIWLAEMDIDRGLDFPI